MAPHQVFSIPDILYAIFDKFSAPEEDITLERERKASLAAAATCCKIVSSPALDILWSDMSSIVPLFQIIPTFGILRGSETKYIFQNVIEQDHWLRFESYACRIRHLSVATDTSLADISDFVYMRTTQYLRGRPLLPRLSFLSVASGLQLLPILLAPTLHGITVLENDGFPGAVLLQSIFEGSPAIQNFTYQGYLSEESYRVLKCMSCLRRLSVYQPEAGLNLPEHFWAIHLESIASLDSLEELLLSFWQTSALSPFPPTDTQTFRTLQSLTLEIPSHLVLSFVKICWFDTLRVFSLFLHIAENHLRSVSLWEEIVDSVGRWGSTLREVSFSRCPAGREVSTAVTGFSYLRPLLDNCRLRKLVVDNDILSVWSDSDILYVTSVWPDLQVLRLVGSIGAAGYEGPLATFTALKYVAEGLPQLRRFEMPMNLSHLSLDSPRTRASHNLKYLCITSIIIGDDPIPVAHHLHGLFPALALSGPKRFRPHDPRHDLRRLLFLCQNAR